MWINVCNGMIMNNLLITPPEKIQTSCTYVVPTRADKSRNEVVSIAKGIGIIIVVLGHCTFGYAWLSLFISSFHMPLFFYLSGYFFKESNYLYPLRYCKKKVRTLYWVFLKWTIPVLLLHNVFCMTGIYKVELLEWSSIFKRVLTLIVLMIGSDTLTGGVWFIKELFLSCLILSLLGWVFHSTIKAGTNIVMAMIMIICLAVAHIEFEFPYGVIGNSVFLAGTMMCIGYFYHRYEIYLQRFIYSSAALTFIIAFMTVLGSSLNLPFMSMHSETARIIPFIFTSLIGLIMIMALSCLCIHSNRYIKSALVYIGNHSLYIYLGHFIAFKLVNIIIFWVMGLDTRMIGEFYIDLYIRFLPVYVMCGCALPLLSNFLYNQVHNSTF